jgi:hypothetical protein
VCLRLHCPPAVLFLSLSVGFAVVVMAVGGWHDVWDKSGNSTRSLADETTLAGRNRLPVHAGQRVSRSVALRRRLVDLHSCAPRLGELQRSPKNSTGRFL